MKKSFAFAFAVLSMTALVVSCQNEEFRDDQYIPGEGEFLFRLSNGTQTKSADAGSSVKGVSIELGRDNGTNFFLEETITNLDDVAFTPETKGTPGYTENFNALYGGFTATVYQLNNTSKAYETDGEFTLVNEQKLIYKRQYDNDLWVSAGLNFFLRAGQQSGVSNLRYDTTEGTDGSITFDYVSPTTATAQEDILFTARKITSESDYNKMIDENNGVPVLFHHALTGVKFAIGNDKQDMTNNKISIKEVIFTGLAKSGTCEVIPVKEDDYKDNISNFSSAGTSLWSDLQPSVDSIRSETFADTVYFAPGGNFGSNKNLYPSSFSDAGNKHNLNKADGSQTFWLIPQVMNADVKLTIKYTFGDADKVKKWTINFGELLADKHVEWKAGELRTYTIRIDDVNVKIEDTVSASVKDTVLTDLSGNTIYKPDGTTPYTYHKYTGTKTNVTITNTANTDAFIRAALIGQWLDEDGNPVFGFTDYTAGKVRLVDSWYQDQFVTKARKHGKFTGLVGYDTSYSGDWVLGDDGYYYYTQIVKAGESVPDDDPLFQSYEVIRNPAVVVAGAVKDVYFTLEISVQAISAMKPDGSHYDTYSQAWDHAKSLVHE